jgi:hypothetical protein
MVLNVVQLIQPIAIVLERVRRLRVSRREMSASRSLFVSLLHVDIRPCTSGY